MKRSIIFVLVTLLALTLGAQGATPARAKPLGAPGDYVWATGMGGESFAYGSDIAVDASGNVYSTGAFSGTVNVFSLTSAGQDDIFVSKFDTDGNFLWAKRMGGMGYDGGSGIVVDASGNVYTTGYFSDTVDFDPGAGIANLTSAGSVDIFVSKFDTDGNFLWAKRMGGTSHDMGVGIAVDNNGNVYNTGSFGGSADFDPGAGTFDLTSAGFEDIFISKLDTDGNFVWAKGMGGGTGSDVGNSIAVDTSGNVHATGLFIGTVDFDPGAGTANLTSAGNFDSFVSKLDASGNFVWAKGMGGTNGDYGLGIALDASGNVHTTGNFSGTADFNPGAGTAYLTSAGGDDIFVSKLNANGDFVWAKRMGGTGFDFGNSIMVDGNGNVHTAGHFSGTADFNPGAGAANLTSVGVYDIFVSKLDTNGNFVWAKSMGGTGIDVANGIAVDASGNAHTVGYFYVTADFDPGAGTANLISAGGTGIFVSKLDVSGNFAWARGMGGTDFDEGFEIALDTSGNAYITGSFSSTVDFDPGAGTANLTSAGYNDIFISKFDANGNFVWAKRMGGANYDSGYGIEVDASGNVYTTGYFNTTVDFDPGTGTTNLTSAGESDIFISKLDTNGNFVWVKGMGGTGIDVANGIAVDASGNVYALGNFNATVDFDPGTGTINLTSVGESDVFVSKLDSSGNFLWAKGFGGTGFDFGNGIALDTSGNVHTTGRFLNTVDFDPGVGTANLTSVAGSWDIFISKLDTNGNFIWAKSMGGIDSDEGLGIAVDTNGNVHTTGYFSGTADFDPGTGTANLTSSAGSADIFVSKLDASGNFVWAKGMGGTGVDEGYGIAVDTSGNVHATGSFNGTVDFDPGAGIVNLASAGYYDIFVSKLDTNGNFVWSKGMGGTGYDEGIDIAMDTSGNIYTTGYFSGTADFDPGTGTANLTSSAGSADIFVSKLKNISTVTFNPNGGYGSMGAQSSSVPTLLMANTFTRPGYTFSGWNTAANGSGTSYTNGATYDFTADLTLYSQWMVSLTFGDVLSDYWAWQYIESLYSAGITGGCGNGNYCPTNPVTRAQMAVFLLKGIHGSSYTPPAVNGNTGFNDVAVDYWAAAWIKQLAAEGITGGCGNGIYCPDNTVTRDQMAIFLLRAEHGSTYTPPDVNGSTGFTDVASDYWAAAWIKQLAAEAITGGCGGGNYCPASPVTRDQMAVFLQRTFSLPLP